MKIGIVGCGLNSDYHINFAKSYPGLEIVGVVDKDENKARECAARFGISNIFPSIKDLVSYRKPVVLHIVTPPKTHFLLAREAIEHGCHVLVEKPMTLNLKETMDLYDLAEKYGVKLCPMHNHFFDPCMAKADDLVRNGDLGDVINVESYYGINSQIPAFRDYPTPNCIPWLYDLPGSVYHDFMPHPLYVLLEYTGKPRQIKVMQQSHGVLPQNLPDEIRILVDGQRAFGTLTFSLAAKPHLHFIRIYGTKMMVEVDINTMTTIVHPLSSLPKAAQKATYNLQESGQLIKSTFSNVYRFLTGKLKPYQGMKELIHRFYDSVKTGGEPPVSKEQAMLVIGTMDEIWKQMTIEPLKHDIIPPKNRHPIRHSEKVLVTGGTGFLGKRLVEMLAEEGYRVRVLARKLSRVENVLQAGAEIYWGDVADSVSLERAIDSVDIVVHAAAGTSGNEKDCATGTLLGTGNILDLCKKHRIKKLVYISSCSVYGVADYRRDQLVREEDALERFPEKRGHYSASKQEAERYVLQAMKEGGLSVVVLRPGTIYGPGGDTFTPMMGFAMGQKLFVVIGNGKFVLPFVYVDNLAGAIIRSIQNDRAISKVFNVVDIKRVTKREYVNEFIKSLYTKARILYMPFGFLYLLTGLQEMMLGMMKRKPFLTRYRLNSSQKSIIYDNSKIIETLDWKPLVSFKTAVKNMIDHETRSC